MTDHLTKMSQVSCSLAERDYSLDEAPCYLSHEESVAWAAGAQKGYADARAALTQPAPEAAKGVPDGFVQVPRRFLTRFYDLAHNYSLRAVAPDYYHGSERDAFEFAYARCGSDLINLRAMLAATPPAPEAQQAKQSVIEQLMDERAHIRQAITLLRDFGADLRLLVPDTESQAVDWEAVRRRFERVMDALAATKPEPQQFAQGVATRQVVPLSEDALLDGFCKARHSQHYASVFIAGARFAERAHGIGVKLAGEFTLPRSGPVRTDGGEAP